MSRQPGYYHIKHGGELFIAKWEQCQHDSDTGCISGCFMWHYTYGGEMIVTDIVDEVDETRIPSPDEATMHVVIKDGSTTITTNFDFSK
jgi:hypothetical protein